MHHAKALPLEMHDVDRGNRVIDALLQYSGASIIPSQYLSNPLKTARKPGVPR